MQPKSLLETYSINEAVKEVKLPKRWNKGFYAIFRSKNEFIEPTFTITADGNIFSCAHLMNNPLFRMGSINNGITSPESYLPPKVTDIVECNKCWARMMCSGGCVTQKISTGMKNTTPMTYNGCELERIKWEFYLKMYYYIEKKCNI